MFFFAPPLVIGLFCLSGLLLLAVPLHLLLLKPDSPVTRAAVFVLSFVLTTLALLHSGDVPAWMFVCIWPVVLVIAAGKALGLGLWVLILGVPILATATVAAAVRRKSGALWLLALGGALSVGLPLVAQDLLAASGMRTGAARAGLVIVQRNSFLDSIRRSDGYVEPHGIACDADGWPSLWSYGSRTWVALPPDTRFGGDTPERVARMCRR